MNSYQNVLQSSLVAHQTAVNAVESSFEVGNAIKEKIALGVIPIAHVALQTGIDRGIQAVSRQVAQRTGDTVAEVSEDFNNGGVAQVGRGILRRGATRIYNAFTQETNMDDPLVSETNIDEPIGQGFQDLDEENFIPSREAASDDVGDIEEMFANIRNQQTMEMAGLNEDEEAESEIQPADQDDDEYFDTNENTPLLDEDEETPNQTVEPEQLAGENLGDEEGEGLLVAGGTGEEVAEVGLLSDPVTAVVGVSLGIATILASVLIGNSHPNQPAVINPSFQQGA